MRIFCIDLVPFCCFPQRSLSFCSVLYEFVTFCCVLLLCAPFSKNLGRTMSDQEEDHVGPRGGPLEGAAAMMRLSRGRRGPRRGVVCPLRRDRRSARAPSRGPGRSSPAGAAARGRLLLPVRHVMRLRHILPRRRRSSSSSQQDDPKLRQDAAKGGQMKG